eukprot:TRINITY_DN760_c0_g2_i2.p1 TRINITY_DN760_c0_g2~~TRINITY_DN760_c0_g2_i2.p1  ORF type:complete len:1834 (-),score=673.82 TRINITY_DN760_c0_g2_i2:3861-9362(-)
MLGEIGILGGDDGALEIVGDARIRHPAELQLRIGILLAQQRQLLPHEAGGLGVMVLPPPDLQEEVGLQQQHQGDGQDDDPEEQLAQRFHVPVLVLSAPGSLGQLLAQAGKDLGGGRAHAAPQVEGFSGLLHQHAQAVTRLGALLLGALHEDGGLAAVHHVVGQRLAAVDRQRQRRQVVGKAGRGGIDDEIEDAIQLRIGGTAHRAVLGKLRGQLGSARLGAVDDHQFGRLLLQQRQQRATRGATGAQQQDAATRQGLAGIDRDIGHQAGAIGVVAEDPAIFELERIDRTGQARALGEPIGQGMGFQLERYRHIGTVTAAPLEHLHRRLEAMQGRQQAFIAQYLAGLGGELRVDLGRFAVGDGIADDDVCIHIDPPVPFLSVSVFVTGLARWPQPAPSCACRPWSRVKRKRVMISHTSSLPLVRMFSGKRPNGAERRTMATAAWSRAALPELDLTTTPPSRSQMVPSWKTGMTTSNSPQSFLPSRVGKFRVPTFSILSCSVLQYCAQPTSRVLGVIWVFLGRLLYSSIFLATSASMRAIARAVSIMSRALSRGASVTFCCSLLATCCGDCCSWASILRCCCSSSATRRWVVLTLSPSSSRFMSGSGDLARPCSALPPPSRLACARASALTGFLSCLALTRMTSSSGSEGLRRKASGAAKCTASSTPCTSSEIPSATLSRRCWANRFTAGKEGQAGSKHQFYARPASLGRFGGRVFTGHLDGALMAVLDGLLGRIGLRPLDLLTQGSHALQQFLVILAQVTGRALGRCRRHFQQARLDAEIDLVPAQQVQLDLQATRQLRQAGHAQHQRDVDQAQDLVLEHHRIHGAGMFLGQPAQAPVAFHGGLEVGIAGIGGVETGDDGEQVRIAWLEGRHQRRGHAMLDAGQDLPLVDQVGVATQRRGAPGVLVHAQALVGRGVGDHAYLHLGGPATGTAPLGAVDAGHAMVGHELAPGTVGEDHQLGHDLVQRRTATAAHDADHVILDVEVEVDAVVLFRTQAEALALDHAALLQHLHPLPQQGNLILVRIVAQVLGQRLFGDQRVEVVVAQVAGDRHQLGATLGGEHFPVGRIQRGVQRQRRTGGAGIQGVGRHQLVGQHGDLLARHVDGGHASTGDRIDGVAALDGQARRSDVDAHAQLAVGQVRHRQRIVDFGGGDVIDGEGLHIGHGQVGDRRGNVDGGKAGTTREELVEEARVVQILRRGHAAGGQHQALRGGLHFLGGGVQGLVFDAVLVGLEEQLQRDRAEGLGQLVCLELVHIGRLRQQLLLLLFLAGQGRLQRSLRGGLVATAALLVEVDRCAMQAQQQTGCLGRQRRVAEVFGGQVDEAELFLAGHFPEEVQVDLVRDGLCLLQQFLRRGRGKLQQRIARLDLGTLAGGHLDLEGLALLGHDGAGLEVAGFFEQYIHLLLSLLNLVHGPGHRAHQRLQGRQENIGNHQYAAAPGKQGAARIQGGRQIHVWQGLRNAAHQRMAGCQASILDGAAPHQRIKEQVGPQWRVPQLAEERPVRLDRAGGQDSMAEHHRPVISKQDHVALHHPAARRYAQGGMLVSQDATGTLAQQADRKRLGTRLELDGHGAGIGQPGTGAAHQVAVSRQHGRQCLRVCHPVGPPRCVPHQPGTLPWVATPQKASTSSRQSANSAMPWSLPWITVWRAPGQWATISRQSSTSSPVAASRKYRSGWLMAATVRACSSAMQSRLKSKGSSEWYWVLTPTQDSRSRGGLTAGFSNTARQPWRSASQVAQKPPRDDPTTVSCLASIPPMSDSASAMAAAGEAGSCGHRYCACRPNSAMRCPISRALQDCGEERKPCRYRIMPARPAASGGRRRSRHCSSPAHGRRDGRRP